MMFKTRPLPITVSLFLLSLCLLPPPASGQQQISMTVTDDTEIDVTRFPAEGEYLLLWLAPDYGFRRAHRQMANRLPGEGIEVWQCDIVESLFLPAGVSSVRQLDGSYVADLIERAHLESGKQVVVAADSYGALGVLAGAREWQRRQHERDYLVGAVLFTPYAYAAIPPLGQAPDYMPIVDATNIPLLILQAQNNPSLHRFDELLERLRQNGSPVYTRLVPGVMSLFFQEEPTPAMNESAAPVPGILAQTLPLLAHHPLPRHAVPMRTVTASDSGIDIYLREYDADIRPSGIDLEDVYGNRVVRNDFTGRVTLINFWATWCAPCVEEIPSLNRLRQQMDGRPFELISINYAEERETVAEFMRRIDVEFPVLLDLDGSVTEKWNVIGYPSTFVIGVDGRIRYGVNAAIEWDDPELVDKLESLID